MTGASAGNGNRAFARAGSPTSRSVARAGISRMRGCCTGPVENPSFHVRSPSSNASNNVGATGVVTAVDSSVRVRVIIVTLLLESGVSRKRNKLTRVLQRLHSFFRRGYLTENDSEAAIADSWLGRLCHEDHFEEHTHHSLCRREDLEPGEPEARAQVHPDGTHLVLQADQSHGHRRWRGWERRAVH